MSKKGENKGTRNLLVIGGVLVGGFFLWQFLRGGQAEGEGLPGVFTRCFRPAAEIPIAPTGVSWSQVGFPKPPISPATTYTKSPIEVGFGVFVDEAAKQAKKTGIPTFVQKGGYYVTEERKYIKGAGW